MIPAESTDGIDDPIHLLQLHAVHRLVQRIEICLDLVVIRGVNCVVGFVEKCQDGVGIAEFRWVLSDVFFQRFEVFFHYHHLQKCW